MQFRYRVLILILVGVISIPLASLASEGDTECPKKKNNQPEDSVGIYDAENKGVEVIQKPVVAKKKSTSEPNTKKPDYKTYNTEFDQADKLDAEDPNSAMSFNFIYYIIDKFKFTDPLE